MIALLAILLQVGPPAPCAEHERLPYGEPAACTGGFLVPRKVVEGYVAAPRVCAVRLDEAAQVAEARVRACSEGVEVLHATLASVVGIFEAGQVEDVARLVEAEAQAAVVAFYPSEGCAEFPELSLDADGTVAVTEHPDGDVYGIVDTHSHIFSNAGFGGGGIFWGAPFHRLGVEHALPDCSLSHGMDGRQDLFGYGFDQGDNGDAETLLTAFVTGRTPEPNHATAGYPDFTDWPNGPSSSTHQTQYYRWLQRAYLAGLRLIVQHATTNEVICNLLVGSGAQPARYSCNDMVAVDHQIEGAFALERYIDAQEGGPGLGWLRIVRSPAEAREVIGDGKLAMILGIEVSNLFDCYHVEREGFTRCDEAAARERLDRYHAMGVRALFPVHKYDNGFSAGDGDRSIIEIGNFVNSGHWSNFTDQCPDVPTVFDRGDVAFGGLNMPRDVYDAPAPNDLSGFGDDPINALSPHLGRLTEPALEGDYCQNAGITPLGEGLVTDVMRRGMILEIDHFNRRAYERVFEMLEAADYPAAGTHGINYDGRIYALGGVSKTGLGRCRDPERPGSMGDRLRNRIAQITAAGAYPAEGFGFDLNGFAGAPGPRMGERSGCSQPQEGPTTYPLTSFAGDVTFSAPQLANRSIDFDTEGFVHIGMLPELIDDARRDGVSDEDLEPLFRSAEGYIRMWERAEARGATM